VADRTVLGRYFVLAGAFRFLLEFVRVNVRVLGPLTVAHCFALLVVVFGLVVLRRTAPPVRH
jgi:prolipoprotein diacylglyceryltransferase